MTLQELHKLTGKLLAEGHGEAAAAINFDTFLESENGSILEIESAELRSVQGADDSGPVGDEYPFLVLCGPDVGETVAALEAEHGTYPPASRTAESVLALVRGDVLTQEIAAHEKRRGTHERGADFEDGFIAGLRHVRDNIAPLVR